MPNFSRKSVYTRSKISSGFQRFPGFAPLRLSFGAPTSMPLHKPSLCTHVAFALHFSAEVAADKGQQSF
eukprot:1898501-Pleurochrysis_carterae.AAC.1